MSKQVVINESANKETVSQWSGIDNQTVRLLLKLFVIAWAILVSKVYYKSSLTLPWENEEEELEETHQDHQEEEALPPQVQHHYNLLQQWPMSKPWAKIPLSSKENERRQTPS